MSLFNRFSEESLDPTDHDPDDEILASLVRMYARYREDLRSVEGSELVDFALLQQRAYDYFRESGAAGSVFRHIIIDEYQDTNAVQEKIFFTLAEGHRNICVVGDDDQSLYRFRGATVENLVQFDERSAAFLGMKPRRIDLSVNYRSRKKIVDFYNDFITRCEWGDQDEPDRYYRIHDKEIIAASSDEGAAVATTRRKNAREVYTEVAEFVKSLKEAQVTFGLFQAVFGKPLYRDREDASAGYRDFQNWLAGCREKTEPLAKADPALQQFLKDRAGEAEQSADDFRRLEESCRGFNLELNDPAPEDLPLRLSSLQVLSLKARRNLTSHNLNTTIRKRRRNRARMRGRSVTWG